MHRFGASYALKLYIPPLAWNIFYPQSILKNQNKIQAYITDDIRQKKRVRLQKHKAKLEYILLKGSKT